MPGIVGLITKMPREQAERELQRMVATLRHESFYKTGTWIEESLGVYVGWVVQENSFSDGMPLHNERGDITLVFSGEEFPEPGEALRLKACGHVLGPQGSSYLVHLSEEDPNFPAKVNGRFHGLLADRTRNTSKLFNDRYGMHRIYYHESKQAFYFAAEAKAILEVRPELRRADPRGFGEFVACGCVLENRTLFEGIHVLPPAAAWVFQDGSIERKGHFFQPREWEEQELWAPEFYYERLREVFSRNLPRYFNGKERIGVSLTGGLDTRMIMAWHKPPAGSLPCYSFGGMYRDCQDVVVARKVAQACGQFHEVIPVEEEFLSNFARYAERAVFLTDGCTAVNRSADLFVNEQARKIAPVRMTGNYGGEVLRRVRAFKPVMPNPELFRPEFVPHIDAVTETYAGLLRGHPLSFAVFRQAPWHHYGLLALEETQLCLRSPYLDNDFVQTVFHAPQTTLANNDISLRLISDGNAALSQIPTDRGFAGGKSGAYAAATQAFIEFTVKAEYAYDYGMPQWVSGVDHAFSRLRLERIFLGRHKFAHFRVWYRDALSEYVREMLLDSRTLSRPYVDPRAVKAIVQGHLEGGRNYTTEIHQLLTLELVNRLFLDPK
ncbi:MAG TPA: asparagine synthase-related protein [Terriglobales bacterium]|jgi:asparagine synthase (glutamine-hydrolysing)|nr:asparagine synthase-related protein [Terriglobales bacterium]